jgi:hypothetical protein
MSNRNKKQKLSNDRGNKLCWVAAILVSPSVILQDMHFFMYSMTALSANFDKESLF